MSKKTTLSILIILPLIAGFLSGCDQQKREMPEFSRTGLGRFGCLADQRVLTAQTADSEDKSYDFEGGLMPYFEQTLDGMYITINANNARTKNKYWHLGVYIDLLDVEEGSRYPISSVGAGHVHAKYINDKAQEFVTTEEHGGEIQIVRFHPVKKILSARFWFNARDSINKSLVEVRDGFFDVSF